MRETRSISTIAPPAVLTLESDGGGEQQLNDDACQSVKYRKKLAKSPLIALLLRNGKPAGHGRRGERAKPTQALVQLDRPEGWTYQKYAALLG